MTEHSIQHTITVTYPGNKNYTSTTKTTTVNVEKLDTNITISVQPTDTYIGESVTINGTLYDAMGNTIPDAWIIISLNNTEYPTKTSADGKYLISNVTIRNDTTEVIAYYEGNTAYNASTNRTQFAVSKINTTTLVSIENSTIGNVSIAVIIKDKDNNTVTSGQIRVTTSEETVTVNVSGDVTNIPLEFTSSGTKKVTVEYMEDNVYLNSTGLDRISYNIDPDHAFIFNNITVIKLNTTLSVNTITPVKAGYSTVIDGVLVDEYDRPIEDATIVVYINQTMVGTATTSSDGSYTFEFNDTIVGTHNVTCRYDGDNTYNSIENSTIFKVVKILTNITINPIDNVTVGNTVSITGILLDEFTNPLNNLKVYVTLDGVNKTVRTDSNGYYNATFSTDSIGNKDVTVNYYGNSYHKATSDETTFNVVAILAILSDIVPDNAKVGRTTSINGSLVDNNGNPLGVVPVNVTVNNQTYSTMTRLDGTYHVIVKNVVPGLNNVTVEAGNENVEAQNIIDKFLATKTDTNLSIDSIDDVKVGEDVTVRGRFTSVDGKALSNVNILVYIDGEFNKAKTDNDGYYELVFTTNNPGKIKVEVSYPGNDRYNGAINSTTFKVNEADVQLTIDTITAKTIADNITITGKVTDMKGKTVRDATLKITVNRRIYNVTTDNEGNYKLPVVNAKIGLNNVTVKLVSEEYNTQEVNTTFTLVKVKTFVEVENLLGVVGQDVTLTAHVTDENANNVTGGYLVFKLNGRSLREDETFDSKNTNPLKLEVNNGLVTFTMKTDLYLRDGTNFTANYLGNNIYEKSEANIADININNTYAQIKVTVTPTLAKQNSQIVFTANITDVTENTTNTTWLTTGYVTFKVNNVTVKDSNGSTLIIPATSTIVNYAYYIPKGMLGVYHSNGTIRDYVVEAIYTNELLDSSISNTTIFNVQRSITNINFAQCIVKNGMLSVKASLTDYEGDNVVGNTKVCIKINEKTYKENGKIKYFTVKDGNIDLNSIKLASGTTVKEVMLVATERDTYLGTNETTTKITTN